ncbi:MAG: hypothetical protein Q8M76_09520 [Spirochaetaceae bacterium]|nr:hypothetical protein [Spirochaetaceae bacterium]
MIIVEFKTYRAAEKGAQGSTTGLTKDAGFQAGARRSYDLSLTQAWSLIVSSRGNELLTGRKAPLEGDGPGAAWEGPPVAYEVMTFVPESHFRMRWRLAEWPAPSIFQVRVLPAANGRTTIAFHQERLADAEDREAMLRRWEGIHDSIAAIVAQGKGGKA